MTELDDAMQEHMAHIVFSERRPFCFKDFLSFEAGGKQYKMFHGTIRNKILAMKKKGIIELCYNSGTAFYTLKGYNFGKSMTPNHKVVYNHPIYKMLENVPFDKQCIHDIRLKLKVPGIWKALSSNDRFAKHRRSCDIIIPAWSRNNTIVKVYIHKKDTISVILGCSFCPIPLDLNGLIRFFSMLARIEEKLQSLLDLYVTLDRNEDNKLIPDYGNWIVTSWHLGRDALVEFNGEQFAITMEDVQHIFARVYSKAYGLKRRIRVERLETPRKSVLDAIGFISGIDMSRL